MIKTITCRATLLAVAVLGLTAGQSNAQNPANTVLITANVPVQAEVWIGNQRMNQSGLTRNYVSPPLANADSTYFYEMRVRWSENGQNVERMRKVFFKPGDRLTVQFRPETEVGTTSGTYPVSTEATQTTGNRPSHIGAPVYPYQGTTTGPVGVNNGQTGQGGNQNPNTVAPAVGGFVPVPVGVGVAGFNYFPAAGTATTAAQGQTNPATTSGGALNQAGTTGTSATQPGTSGATIAAPGTTGATIGNTGTTPNSAILGTAGSSPAGATTPTGVTTGATIPGQIGSTVPGTSGANTTGTAGTPNITNLPTIGGVPNNAQTGNLQQGGINNTTFPGAAGVIVPGTTNPTTTGNTGVTGINNPNVTPGSVSPGVIPGTTLPGGTGTTSGVIPGTAAPGSAATGTTGTTNTGTASPVQGIQRTTPGFTTGLPNTATPNTGTTATPGGRAATSGGTNAPASTGAGTAGGGRAGGR